MRRCRPVLAAACVLAAVTGCSDEGVTQAVDRSDEFAERVERFARASIGYEERLTRTAGATSLEVDAVTVLQAFPEKVTVGERVITGRIDGRSVGCNDVTGSMTCVDNGAVDVEGDAEADIAELADSIAGERPLWWVTAGSDEGCYELTAIRVELAARWGERALVCFDSDSALMTSETIDVEGGRDVVERALVRERVEHADLVGALPTFPTQQPAAAGAISSDR